MKRWIALAMVATALLMGACAEEEPLFPTGASPSASPSGSDGSIGGQVG